MPIFQAPGRLPAPPPTAWLDRMFLQVKNSLAGPGHRAGAQLEIGRRILERARGLVALDDEALRSRIRETMAALRRKSETRGPQAIEFFLAAMCETVRRVYGFVPHVEQLAGVLGLDGGRMVEMATGEGKTLVAGMGALLKAARGRRCHVFTANDYLASRDAVLLGGLADWCGVRVTSVTGEVSPGERAGLYSAPVVYSTAKEVLADFLRDRLSAGPGSSPMLRLARAVATGQLAGDGRTLPTLDSAIVDEADHVLIDEAVTPLIISRKEPNPAMVEAVMVSHALAGEMREGEHYQADFRYREIVILKPGLEKIESSAGRFPPGWASFSRRVEMVNIALQARELYLRDQHYAVHEGKVAIIDESTGRLMPDRQWQQGLHQAVEAKEGLEPGAPTVTAARMSFQRFFRLYHQVSGLTGTAWEARHEFHGIYGVRVLKIPTHRPCLRVQYPERVIASESRWEEIARHIREKHKTGRPVLVGTRTVADSKVLAELLVIQGLEVEVLNAVHHAREAEIVAGAGGFGRITIATNMAGRGTDIKLAPGVAEAGGLHVVACERHASERVDRQLAGRAGRQGDPGSVQIFLCPQDEILRRHGSSWLRSLGGRLVSVGWLVPRLVRRAQKSAGRRDESRRRQLLLADYRLEESFALSPDDS